MLDSYTQTLQDQIGQLSKLLGGQNTAASTPGSSAAQSANRYDCVDGLEGARSFMGKMLASTKHIVWDSNKDVFYVLEKDANGTAQRIKICPFTVELEQTPEERYVTKDDFNVLAAKLDKLLSSKGVKNTDNG